MRDERSFHEGKLTHRKGGAQGKQGGEGEPGPGSGVGPAGSRGRQEVANGDGGADPKLAFELDGGSWEVDNNVWLVGDDEEVVVIDAGHEAAPILEQVGERRVVAVVCTHAHNDHVNAAAEVADASVAPILSCCVSPTRPR